MKLILDIEDTRDGLNVEVFIVALTHQKRNPNIWKKRL